MAKKEYDSFVDNPEKLPGGEMALAIRELTPDNPRKKYLTRYVKCVIACNPETMPEGDVLWMRWQRGRKYPKPFAIKIVEELGAFLPREVQLEG
jgi:hypothetical protein